MVCLASTGKLFDAENSFGSNIDDIRVNTMLVANCLYFLEIQLQSIHWNFVLRVVVYASALHKKISLKSDTERGKYALLAD